MEQLEAVAGGCEAQIRAALHTYDFWRVFAPRKLAATLLLREDRPMSSVVSSHGFLVMQQLDSVLEIFPTISACVFITSMQVSTSLRVWMSKTRRTISRGNCEVCTRLTVIRMSSLRAPTRTLGRHLANTQMFPD